MQAICTCVIFPLLEETIAKNNNPWLASRYESTNQAANILYVGFKLSCPRINNSALARHSFLLVALLGTFARLSRRSWCSAGNPSSLYMHGAPFSQYQSAIKCFSFILSWREGFELHVKVSYISIGSQFLAAMARRSAELLDSHVFFFFSGHPRRGFRIRAQTLLDARTFSIC